jgi:hypothetical protein
MKSGIQAFNLGIKELLIFINCTEDENELIGKLRNSDLISSKEKELLGKIAHAHINRKRYIYSVAIISLYGLLEQLIDTLIEAYVRRLADSVNEYQKLPEAIRKSHTPLSIDLLKGILDERYWTNEKQEDVIANLHSCVSNATPFRINSSAFIIHRGNITLSKIADFLSAIGINNPLKRASSTTAMLEYFAETQPGRDIIKICDKDIEALFKPIDELVERRNQISHGVVSIDEIESTELLKERCRFVSSYSKALYEILIQDFLKYRINLGDIQSLGKPIAVHGDSIVCFESNNCKIAVGNLIVADRNKSIEPVRYSKIDELQIDNQSYPEILISESTNFGAKVSFKVSKNYEYYVFTEEAIYSEIII